MSNPKYDHLVKTIREIHDAKSHDYAQESNKYSNFEYAAMISERFSDPIDRVFATQIGIKMARLAELTSAGKKPKNETVQDTRRDLANYAMIWASYTEDPSEKGDIGIKIGPGSVLSVSTTQNFDDQRYDSGANAERVRIFREQVEKRERDVRDPTTIGAGGFVAPV